MGIDICLGGSYSGGLLRRPLEPQTFLSGAARFAKAWWGDAMYRQFTQRAGAEGPYEIALWLHPATETLRIRAPRRGVVEAEARTNVPGPGYHEAVCDFLKALAKELRIRWNPEPTEELPGDETDFFRTGDRAALQEAMFEWLNQVASHLRSERVDGDEQIAISMAIHSGFEYVPRIGTALGPRDDAWLDAVAGGDRTVMKDFFPWWDREQNAIYMLRRALCLMWSDVRWSPPETEEDKRAHAEVLRLLDRAYASDPTLSYPWREWRELLRHDSGHAIHRAIIEMRAREVEAKNGSEGLIGYRRRNVRAHGLPHHWSISIPGSFAEVYDEESATWRAWLGNREVHVSAFSVVDKARRAVPALELLETQRIEGKPGEPIEWSDPPYQSRGLCGPLGNPDAPGLNKIQGVTAIGGRVATITLVFEPTAEGREWAMATWKSIRVAGAESNRH